MKYQKELKIYLKNNPLTMEILPKIHGTDFGSFWSCQTCTKKEWSPKFICKVDVEEHIRKNHMKKITFNDKINNIMDILCEFDKEFETLAKYDKEECIERVKYFIDVE